jgi:hypothetical protein
MLNDERSRYLNALGRFDAVADENPNDNWSDADHDRALYGDTP